jgi:hypothetical protein
LALIPNRPSGLPAGILIFGIWSVAAGAATPEDGRRAYDAGHFTDAMGIWAKLSSEGSAEADFGLGLLYDLGNGTPEDPQSAFFWYRLAAEAGLPAAEFNVGAMYDSGRGIGRDLEAAADWYAKAAARGHHRAQYDLGQMYEHGDGVPRNPEVAAAWLKAAAAGGVQAAADRLKALDANPRSKLAGPLTAATLASPAVNATVMLTPVNPMVELVWMAPPEPQLVRYEVEVREATEPAQRLVAEASVTTTAIAIRLPIHANSYIWKVDTVARDGDHSPSDWNWFSVVSREWSVPPTASAAGAPRSGR